MAVIIVIGTILVLVSLGLPWAEVRSTIGGLVEVQHDEISGYEIIHGWTSVAGLVIALIAALINPKSRAGGAAAVLAGAFVILITVSALTTESGGIFGSDGSYTIESGATFKSGIYIALAGGIVATIGGVVGLTSKR